MKIVLLDNVKKLGKKNDIIEVSDGYARNFIIPRKLGVPATADNINNVKLKNKNEEKMEDAKRKNANELSNVINNSQVEIKLKAGQNGKTFGSVTSKEIKEALLKDFNIDIDKKDIELLEPIKSIGKYVVKIKIYKDIFANLKVLVNEE